MELLNSKIARRLVIYILLCSSVITLLLTSYQLWRNYASDISSIKQRIQQISVSDVRSLSAALWVLDINSMHIQIQGLESLPDMQYIAIIDKDGKAIVSEGEILDTNIIEQHFPLEYSHRGVSIPIGRLHVQASLEGVYQRLLDEATIILLTQAAKTFLVSLFIFFIVQWLITRHLHSIASHTANINLDEPNAPLVLDRKRSRLARGDELDQVVDSINNMEQKLWAAFQQIHAHREQLEAKVQDRTWDLEQSTKEMTMFCYTVSHDLRAPLRSINGFADILVDSYGPCIDAEGLDYLSRVKNAAIRMGELIDDLLSLSRVTQSDIHLTEVDVSAMCREISCQLMRQIPKRDIQWDIEKNLRTQGDVRMLRIALENLLGNAYKYTSKTEHARIQIGCQSDHGTEVFFIKDNGAGFNPEYIDKLFAPFHRLHSSSEFEGTGIGLATVERIILRHKGHIWAKSEPNQGATFFFTLRDSVKTQISA